jgi:prolyl-tRNA synthetase
MAHPVRTSRLWPPVRPRRIDLGAPTFGLLQAVGLVRQLDLAGSFALMPLGVMVRDRMEAIIRESFVERGFGTALLPILQSRTIWERSRRWDIYADSGALFRVAGHGEEVACLGPTSEEICVSVVAADLASYRDLPVRLYQSTQKFRNELSPRGGLMRAREFEMADAYTFDATREGMLASVEDLNAACRSALTRIGFPEMLAVSADGGDISRAPSTEHAVRSDIGQSDFVECSQCGYRADPEVAAAAFLGPGQRCGACGEGLLESFRSVELGHVFELGDRYSDPMGLRFTDRDDRPVAPLMACSGIGIGRCLQTLAHLLRDERGLRWPSQVAPAQVHMIATSKGEEAESRASRLQGLLLENDVAVLRDDREVSLGEKFRYAWALGLPYQVVISSRTEGARIEWIERATGAKGDTDAATLITMLKAARKDRG